jgi:membrane protease YdiL (CAAX protease family)
MLLAACYVYAITSPVVLSSIVLAILMGLLALALWQKARDHLVFLLDPSMSPPSSVSTADGLMAATLFFVVQALVSLLPRATLGEPSAWWVLIAYAVAGAFTYCLARYSFWRLKTAGVPLLLRGLAAGWAGPTMLAALVAIGCGIAYLRIVPALGLDELASPPPRGWRLDPAWLLALACLAAPLCEEFIFRGLIFGGLRRSLGFAPAALASAGVFAIVHPAISWLPVFVLGLCAAWTYERTRALIAPMLVHASYNACVVGLQLYSPGTL